MGKNKIQPIGHSIIKDNSINMNFSSVKGQEFNKIKQIEEEAKIYLNNNKGIAIVIDPIYSNLPGKTEILVNLTVYNENVGDFEDELTCKVKGLPDRKFPINIKVRGNPLQLSPFQPDVDYSTDPPRMKMGHVIINAEELYKTFKLLNTGSTGISVDWKIYDLEEIENPKRDVVKVRLEEVDKKGIKSFKLNYKPIEPKEFIGEQCFKIDPKLYIN